ncbi:Transposon Tn7 transposition protein TnsB [Anaerolineae bacterium]|nr:Transposon Tn7 transposition protein TnsB [Anaerolineae bacterium]
MARIRVTAGTRYTYQDQIYVIRDVLGDSCYKVQQAGSGQETVISYEEIFKAWEAGLLRFEVVRQKARQRTQISIKTVGEDLADLPEGVRQETWRRYQLVLDVLQFYAIESVRLLPRRDIETYIKEKEALVGQKTSSVVILSSAKSIERYMQALVDSGGDIRSLVPQTSQRGGKGQTRMDEAIERILQAVLANYASITERESSVDQIMTDVLNAVADENRFREPPDRLTPPSESTLRRRIKAAGEQRILGRQLSRREQKVQAVVQSGIRPSRILERVEIDHTTLDLFVVDEQDGLPIGRPTITACIDKYSALVPGWHIGFQQGGYESVMLCLCHAILPKPNYQERYHTEHDYPVYGLFEKLCIDHGPDFKSVALKDALAELGIIREEMPKETPWFKGSIERYFRSVNQRLLKGKPGYTFGNTMHLGDYDAQKDAVISLSAFLEMFHIFMVDIYPYTWHEGLEAIPMQRWQESRQLFKPDLFEDANALRLVLLPSAERVLQPRGIEWEHIFYRGPELARLRELHGKEKVRFKYDPDDLDVVYVRDRTSATGWLEFRSTNPDYTRGLSLAKHHVIRQYVSEQKQAVDSFSLARAKAHIQQVIEREFLTTTKLRRRSKLKSLLQLEPPSVRDTKPKRARVKPIEPTDSEEDLPQDMAGWSGDYGLPITRGEKQ